MRLFKFWVREVGALQIDGETAAASCWGGSNVSIEDARAEALKRLGEVQQRIDRQSLHSNDTSYEVDIREEVIEELDLRNIVSRNRYGALVLNSADTLIMDIDKAPVRWNAFWLALLPGKSRSRKETIFELIRKAVAQLNDPVLTFRMYETYKGVRVIVTGRAFDPRSEETAKLFKTFSVDRLYAYLCQKQNCFRARLSPKPHRAKCPGHKVVYPRTEDQQSALTAWLERYEAASMNVAICRFVESLGPGGDSRIVSFHDSATKALKTLKLA